MNKMYLKSRCTVIRLATLVLTVLFLFVLTDPASSIKSFDELQEEGLEDYSGEEQWSVPEVESARELFYAVWEGDHRKVSALLKKGIDPNTKVPLKGGEYRTLPYDATYKGHMNVLRLLLARGADPNAQNSNGKTPLHLAAQRGQIKFVRVLLEAGASPNIRAEDGSTALISASFSGKATVVELLLKNEADVNARTYRTERTALHMAATRGSDSSIYSLVQHGSDIDPLDDDGNTPLCLAVTKGYDSAVLALLDSGANPDLGATPPIIYAARTGNEDILHMLIAARADINRTDPAGHTALLEAAARGESEMAEFLLANGADHSLADDMGQTALHHAKDAAMAEVLLRYGAHVDRKDNDGNTLLLLTAERAGHRTCITCDELARMLVQNNADVLAKNLQGNSILHAATLGDLKWLIDTCLEKGADINGTNNEGRTPLHLAAMQIRPSAELIGYLIEKGAEVNARDNEGKTPLDLILELPPSRTEDAVQILVQHGAQSSGFQEP